MMALYVFSSLLEFQTLTLFYLTHSSADLVHPASFVLSPFMTQPILASGRVSLTQMQNAETPDPALQRAVEICQAALKKMNEVWMGVSWVRVALDNLARGRENSGLSEEEMVKIRTRDRGIMKRAEIDAATRDWLVTALGGEGGSASDVASTFFPSPVSFSPPVFEP